MTAIQTASAPAVVGVYSQARLAGDTLYLSGQIGLDPASGKLVDGFEAQAQQVFDNIAAVCEAAEFSLARIQKLTILLADLDQTPIVNDIMKARFTEPYPARATYEVSRLPLGALIEVEGVAC